MIQTTHKEKQRLKQAKKEYKANKDTPAWIHKREALIKFLINCPAPRWDTVTIKPINK